MEAKIEGGSGSKETCGKLELSEDQRDAIEKMTGVRPKTLALNLQKISGVGVLSVDVLCW